MLMDLKFLNQTMVVLIGSIYQHQHWITINPLIFNFKEEVTEEYILAQEQFITEQFHVRLASIR